MPSVRSRCTELLTVDNLVVADRIQSFQEDFVALDFDFETCNIKNKLKHTLCNMNDMQNAKQNDGLNF